MAQGSELSNSPAEKIGCQVYDNSSRKAGFQAIQKSKEQGKKDQEKKSNPWGPVFKDRKNFVNMHNC